MEREKVMQPKLLQKNFFPLCDATLSSTYRAPVNWLR